MTLSPRLPSRIWAIQKEIKDAYPKMVCHMPKRHDRKKECQEKRKDAYPKKVRHMSTRHVEKKREKKYIYPMFKKNIRREIDHAKEFIHYQPKIFHTLACLDQIV